MRQSSISIPRPLRRRIGSLFVAISCLLISGPGLVADVSAQVDENNQDRGKRSTPADPQAATDTPKADKSRPSDPQKTADDSFHSWQIREAIINDLDDAESIQQDQIDVEVNDGLVTLSGRVGSLMDKRRAATIAKRTRNVEAVLNQIIVRRSDRPSEEIRDDVLMRIKANDSLERLEIVVAVDRGEVAMTGKVDSLAEKRLAEIAAAGVRGVISVDNQLTVAPLERRTDEALRAEINGLIVNSVYLDDVRIDVQVRDSVAYLSGSVGSVAQKEHLERVAEIWGILKVNVDEVSIEPELADETERKRRFAAVSDANIQQAIQRALYNDPLAFVDRDRIDVDVDSGIVKLSGTVRRLRIKREAERVAMDVVGVIEVINQLEVRYDHATPTDETIIRLTQASIARSPYLDRREIRVHCQHAHVSLYGVVDNQFEKDLAEWNASGVPGVVHVNNSLAIESEWEPKSDEAIESSLQSKLDHVLFAGSNEINVEVHDGVAILTGEVDTWRQWQAALDLALEAGARNPHNLLRVRYHPPHRASRIFVPR